MYKQKLKKHDKVKCINTNCCSLPKVVFKVLSVKNDDFITLEMKGRPIRQGGVKMIGCKNCLRKIYEY